MREILKFSVFLTKIIVKFFKKKNSLPVKASQISKISNNGPKNSQK